MLKHNLTEASMHDIFTVVSFILPVGNVLCSSFSEFKVLFSALKYPIRKKSGQERKVHLQQESVYQLFHFQYLLSHPCSCCLQQLNLWFSGIIFKRARFEFA